ncbi:hypothetical protein RJ640_025922 [Escallonia rubra]|uniref:RING-type E3 ubiquitin transferase n=1 Tax=Escallonia rubra TaxID=112253 RepID=A0AA88RPG5_9ASTE|nr:hypothetical protein RJ640_025922 [Escallonia rubra]
MTSCLPAIDSINRSLSEICAAEDRQYSWENPRRFSGYAKRLQLLLRQLLRSSSPESLPASVQTSLKGVAGDLARAVETMSVYTYRSKIFVLINCHALCSSLCERAVAIGGWLALLGSAVQDNADLHKKISDLSRDMKQAHFGVTENEERVHRTLQREGQGRQNRKVLQSAIVMDLARALGISFDNQAEISEQVKLLKDDLTQANMVTERQILKSLERIVDNWSTEPDVLTQSADLEFEDDAHISPFKNFQCPLTKDVMKDPVVLESSQNYERTAIEYWFEQCIEDGREVTCPVTGRVLNSLELKPNIGLAGAIEEWVNRNIESQVKVAVQYLSDDPPLIDCVERALDNIFKISEEHTSSRYIMRNAGIVVLIVKVLRNCSKIVGSHLRSKSLMALLSMAKDEESKMILLARRLLVCRKLLWSIQKIMLEEGITRLAIHSLIGGSEKEREYGVKLLLEFSSDETYCVRIASEKGALFLLLSMAGNLEHPALSNLAEEILKRMERVEDNVQHLAAAGRFKPLLSRLCEGSADVKIEMASMVGRMTLTNSCKEQIARQGAKVLVDLLSKPEGRAPSLRALCNLSSLDDNATVLVDSAVLPALTAILFEKQDATVQVKEFAAAIIGNIVSSTGHWELASAEGERHLMQSKSIVFGLLELLSIASSQCQASILRILCGIASSPQASEAVIGHIKSGDGLKTIILFLEHSEVDQRVYAFRLIRVLSERLAEDLANELKPSNKLPLFKEKILDTQSTEGERSDAACILANLPLSDNEVTTVLGASLVRWTVATLKDRHRSTNGRTTRPTSIMVEGLLGILLHFTRNPDQQSDRVIKEHRLLTIFREQLVFTSKPKEKKLAALGLKYLSESGRTLAGGDPDPQPPQGFCSSLVFMCGRASKVPSTCPIHNSACEEDSQFCLLKSNCIKPLVELLVDVDTRVQISAVEALSTLVLDTSNGLKRAVEELEHLGVVDAVIVLFTQACPGELQEKALWMVERILRVEPLIHRHSLNQSLVRALVEAFKHGNPVTRRHAQECLTHLKQISGVSGKTSTQNRGWR